MSEYKKETISIKCPECAHEFDQRVEITIHDPSIEVDVEAID